MISIKMNTTMIFHYKNYIFCCDNDNAMLYPDVNVVVANRSLIINSCILVYF
jgi:uncharacterized protein (DUF779 family)